jgi:hypothetical protein
MKTLQTNRMVGQKAEIFGKRQHDIHEYGSGNFCHKVNTSLSSNKFTF